MTTMNEATRDFVRRHLNDDVRQTALLGARDTEVDLAVALQQIAGRQAARRKLPSWAAVDDIVYPPHLAMEQCSSEPTARYKAGIVRQLGVDSLCDLTGGFGVDFAFMAGAGQSSGAPLQKAIYVERQDELCRLARHNFQTLGLKHAEVVCADGEDFLQQTDKTVDLFFLDPARRDSNGSRTYALADCTPDVTRLLPLLLLRARHILLKLSPMLDWRQAVAELQHVSTIHIVSVQNECKELLIHICRPTEPEPTEIPENPATPATPPLRVVCVNLAADGRQETFAFSPHRSALASPSSPFTSYPSALASPPFSLASHLYEPNASVMKAGCFELLETTFGLRQIAPNSHLFLTDKPAEQFPGRHFLVRAVTSLNKKELRKALQGLTQANITVRNFPMSAADLRRRLKLRDGGSVYLFATTLADRSHVLFVCEKA